MLPADTCYGQDLCQLDRSAATQYGRKPLSQFLMDDSSGEWQADRFIQRGGFVCAAHNVFYGIDMIICNVMTLQGIFFLFTEPVTGACKQFLFQLGIDLCMFYLYLWRSLSQQLIPSLWASRQKVFSSRLFIRQKEMSRWPDGRNSVSSVSRL